LGAIGELHIWNMCQTQTPLLGSASAYEWSQQAENGVLRMALVPATCVAIRKCCRAVHLGASEFGGFTLIQNWRHGNEYIFLAFTGSILNRHLRP
jgi:hypothetical protein